MTLLVVGSCGDTLLLAANGSSVACVNRIPVRQSDRLDSEATAAFGAPLLLFVSIRLLPDALLVLLQ